MQLELSRFLDSMAEHYVPKVTEHSSLQKLINITEGIQLCAFRGETSEYPNGGARVFGAPGQRHFGTHPSTLRPSP